MCGSQTDRQEAYLAETLMRLTRLNGLLSGCLGAFCLLRGPLPVHGRPIGGNPGWEYPCGLPIQEPQFLGHVGIQYLNGGAPIPGAFNVHSAVLDATGAARFRVYALTDDPRFYGEITSHYDCDLHVSLRPNRHLEGAREAIALRWTDAAPEIVYMPRTVSLQTRRERLTFRYHLRHWGTYSGSFDLTIPGVRLLSDPQSPIH